MHFSTSDRETYAQVRLHLLGNDLHVAIELILKVLFIYCPLSEP